MRICHTPPFRTTSAGAVDVGVGPVTYDAPTALPLAL
ncbi:Uncharacterised protein [Burkholderia pseudomallei]|nr:Uncharacterised protein [Burkholderia pseudomallei]